MPLILNGTTGVSGIDGSAGTPSYQGGDTNTGIFYPAADTIAFAEGGAEIARFDSSGNLGIGTTSPSSKLTVAGTFNSTGNATVTSGSTGTAIFQIGPSSPSVDGAGYIRLINSNSVRNWQISSNGVTTVGSLEFTPSSASGGTTFSTPSVTITSGSNLFVNTTSVGAWGLNPMLVVKQASTSSAGGLVSFSSANDNATFVGYDGANSVGVIGVSYGSSGSYTPLTFQAGGAERMRITSGGQLLVGATANQVFSGVTADHAFIGPTGNGRWIAGFRNSGNSTPWGVVIGYSGASPNNSSQDFFWCEDSSGLRAAISSNGGLRNYSGNNVNLSDAREKTNVELAGSYLDKICAIPVKTFNYIDQNREEDDGLTLGVIAQDVQSVAPELVMESDWSAEKDGSKMRLSIYQTDLQYALMKCIQEQQAMIEELKAKVAALETK